MIDVPIRQITTPISSQIAHGRSFHEAFGLLHPIPATLAPKAEMVLGYFCAMGIQPPT
ncbi:hypothetical protein SAMN04487897_108110 [Paenibacillus sp. yr247]|nr:hypothetical protein SAMN04487897_108110 [Paenibacillus sp. yr247]